MEPAQPNNDNDLGLPTRFWDKVDKNGPVPLHKPELGPCWLWTAAVSGGYGSFSLGNWTRAGRWTAVKWQAHRLTLDRYLVATTGSGIARGKLACHHCDTPGCVRPSHLFAGTYRDNARDRNAKGRDARGRKMARAMKGKIPIGEDRWAAKLTEKDVRKIRMSKKSNTDLAIEFDVDQSTVCNIRLRKRWKHVA